MPEREPDVVETAAHTVFEYQERLGMHITVEADVLYDVGECVVRIWLLDVAPAR